MQCFFFFHDARILLRTNISSRKRGLCQLCRSESRISASRRFNSLSFDVRKLSTIRLDQLRQSSLDFSMKIFILFSRIVTPRVGATEREKERETGSWIFSVSANFGIGIIILYLVRPGVLMNQCQMVEARVATISLSLSPPSLFPSLSRVLVRVLQRANGC